MLRFLGLAAALTAIVLLLSWQTNQPDHLDNDPPLVFRSLAERPVLSVKSCILSGNSGSAFSNFKRVSSMEAKVGRRFDELLIDERGSRIFIGLKGLDTVVTYRSIHDPTEQQLELLQRCSNNLAKL